MNKEIDRMTIDEINSACKDTFMELLGIEFTAATESSLEARMPITPKLYQPMEVVHGGALISLAESVGSAASFLLVDPDKFNVLGSSVNSQHLAPARKGTLTAKATLLVKADFKHIWDVKIEDDTGKLISISRVTNSIKPRKPEELR
ncbi:MAG: thioesterase [Bacteroidetes bacterium]|nr:MAG: thioesterase [Bacteroidota bacterium]RLD93675.1 MAG: thioesterase [Bacteroidota bacterium]